MTPPRGTDSKKFSLIPLVCILLLAAQAKALGATKTPTTIEVNVSAGCNTWRVGWNIEGEGRYPYKGKMAIRINGKRYLRPAVSNRPLPRLQPGRYKLSFQYLADPRRRSSNVVRYTMILGCPSSVGSP